MFRPIASIASAALVAGLITVATPQVTHAYCASPNLSWPAASLRVRGVGLPQSWTPAMDLSAASWSGVSDATWRVGYVEPGFVGPVASPYVHAYLQSSAPPGWGGAPALVDLRYSGSAITGGTIYFNSAFTWNTSGTMDQSARRADVRTIATHELGHHVYLNHPGACGAMTTAETASVMHPNWTRKWGLRADDLAGLRARK